MFTLHVPVVLPADHSFFDNGQCQLVQHPLRAGAARLFQLSHVLMELLQC